MLARRLRRRASIKSTLVWRIVFAGDIINAWLEKESSCWSLQSILLFTLTRQNWSPVVGSLLPPLAASFDISGSVLSAHLRHKYTAAVHILPGLGLNSGHNTSRRPKLTHFVHWRSKLIRKNHFHSLDCDSLTLKICDISVTVEKPLDTFFVVIYI